MVHQLDHPRDLRPHHQRPKVDGLRLEGHSSDSPHPVHVEVDSLLRREAPPLLSRRQGVLQLLHLLQLGISKAPHLGLVDVDGHLEAIGSLPPRGKVHEEADLLVAAQDAAVGLDGEDAGAALRDEALVEDGDSRGVFHVDGAGCDRADAGRLDLQVVRLQLDGRGVAPTDQRQLHPEHGAAVEHTGSHMLVALRLQRAEHEGHELRAVRHDEPVVGLAAEDPSLVLSEEIPQRRVCVVVHLDDLIRLVAHGACREADPGAGHPELRSERLHADGERVAAADGSNTVRRDEVLVRDEPKIALRLGEDEDLDSLSVVGVAVLRTEGDLEGGAALGQNVRLVGEHLEAGLERFQDRTQRLQA
eukprot:443711-Hanusia_phi.AAC.1